MSEIPASGRDESGQGSKVMAVIPDDAVSDWFLREVVPLEPLLMHYLQHNWRNANDLPDLRQEVYVRVFEAAREQIPENPKRFLLTSARNLLIDLIRRKRIVPMETFADFDVLGVAANTPAPDQMVIEKEELGRIKTALVQLPPRTREAIELTYFENLSCSEIAKRMKVTKQTASEFIAKGTLALGEILFAVPGERNAKS